MDRPEESFNGWHEVVCPSPWVPADDAICLDAVQRRSRLTLYDAVISYVIPALIIVVIQHWGEAYLRGQASRADQQN